VTGALLFLLLTAWPAPDATVRGPELPAATKRLRVFIDAGHGAPNNEGNHGCWCQAESGHTLVVARHLAFVLSDVGGFDVKLSRVGAEQPTYAARLDAARAWRADVIISLHSDSRGAEAYGAVGDAGCLVRADAPGFSVLYSDEGTAAVVAARARLGQAVGARLRESGFTAYDGADYTALYRQDAVEPSLWIDARPPGKRVFFLRAATIPTVIVETHHALYPAEAECWQELATLDAFALSVAAALRDVATR
jgi:N-acetylmuramoyl-L-alanine amidase